MIRTPGPWVRTKLPWLEGERGAVSGLLQGRGRSSGGKSEAAKQASDKQKRKLLNPCCLLSYTPP